MQSGNNIHVQQHKTNIRNRTKHKMMPILSPFMTLHAVTFVLPDEMADVSVAGTAVGYTYTLIKPHRVSLRPINSHSKLYLHRGKEYRNWNKNYPACCNPTNYRESSRSYLILVTSYDMP